MRNLRYHIQFLLSATNQHGVHSPFIYTYVTQCLYVRKTYVRKKSENILLKSIGYFEAKRVWIPSVNNGLQESIQREFPMVTFDHGPYDILYLDLHEAVKLLNDTSEEHKVHNDTVLLIYTVRDKPSLVSLWEKIKNHHEVRVTVDLFYCAGVFFRKEQAKQHFKIRT
ncbi:hypothetical protein LCGC14_1810160 [marine sediment metagenome]|uniref:Uncharacterized protein n=2 Tax=root TaxID=1 RepID=A0A831VQE5_9FLAO|nr:hypothetical protein [Pricia antarctica]